MPLVSPAEAATIWCPWARVATHSSSGDRLITAANKDTEGQIRNGATCIATKCMAWVAHTKDTGYCGLCPVPEEARPAAEEDPPAVRSGKGASHGKGR